MLVIGGTIRIDPAKRAAAIAAAKEVMEETRKEEGCISYTLASDLAEDDLFVLFEEWESQAALDRHFATPHLAKFQSQMAGFGVKELKVKRFEVASATPIGG